MDYIFTRSADILRSSFDLTCGENPPGEARPNCKDYTNRDYYSDHRLLWTLIADGPSE